MEGHAQLVELVKSRQRGGEAARRAWRCFCDARGDGIRDPKRHSEHFLRGFLEALDAGELASEGVLEEEEHGNLALVESSSLACGAGQIVLLMPASEEPVMKEVVDRNEYGLSPGRSCVLRENDVLLDVGAHVGVAASLALKTPGTRVVCIEPHPTTFSILQRNMAEHGARAKLFNVGVSDVMAKQPLYAHRGTNNPSRLFFASLFDTRAHEEKAIPVQCVRFQDLIDEHQPDVVKIDAEGAERFLADVGNFNGIRLIVAEWDWTHNRQRSLWNAVERHLQESGFEIKIKGRMPDFDQNGIADLTDSKGRKRGKTGMVFNASRSKADFDLAERDAHKMSPPRVERITCWSSIFCCKACIPCR